MRHTRGSIERLPSGAWRIRKRATNPTTGARYIVFEDILPADTPRAQVERRQVELLHQFQTGRLVAPTKITVAEAFDGWMAEEMVTRFRSQKGKRNYLDVIAHWKAAAGHVLVDQLGMGLIQQTMNGWAKDGTDGVAIDSVNKRRMVLRSMLDYAERQGLVPRNQADLVKPLKVDDHQERAIWSLDQVGTFLTLAKQQSPYYALYRVAAETGLRIGEILALRWVDVNLATGQVTVVQSVQRTPQVGIEWGKGKTDSAQRAFVLSATTIDALRTLKVQQAKQRLAHGASYATLGINPKTGQAAGPLVFAQPDGLPLHAHNIVRRDFHPLVEYAHLPQIHFHDLRHFNVSLQVDLGVPDHIRQQRTGHASEKTARPYIHAMGTQHEDAAVRIGQALDAVIQ